MQCVGEQAGEDVDGFFVGPVGVDLEDVVLDLWVGGGGAGGLAGELVACPQGLDPQGGDGGCRGEWVAVGGVAGGVGGDQPTDEVGSAADDLLGDVGAEAEPDQHDRRAGKVIQEGEHVLDSRVEVEAPGGRAVSAEVGGHDAEASA